MGGIGRIKGLVVVGALALAASCATLGGGTVVRDPGGKFAFTVPAGLVARAGGEGLYHYGYERPPLEVYIVTAAAKDEAEGVAASFERAGVPFASLSLGGLSSRADWKLRRYDRGSTGAWAAIAYQYHAGIAYSLIVSGGVDSDPDSLPQPIQELLQGIRLSGIAREKAPATAAELEAYMDGVARSSGGSVSVAASREGRLLFRHATGERAAGAEADAGTAYHWGSITKLLTATAVMREVERGRIDLDATLDRYFPDFAIGRRITVRNLLGHASGLPNLEVEQYVSLRRSDMPSISEVWNGYSRGVERLAFDPGTTSSYNNYNFLALGAILESVTGEALTAYVEREILVPLGMRHTAYFTEDLPSDQTVSSPIIGKEQFDIVLANVAPAGLDRGSVVAAETDRSVFLVPLNILSCWGGAKGSAEDALRFASLFLDAGLVDGKRFLGTETVRLMMTAQKSPEGAPLAFGLGWMIGEDERGPYVEHGGGGPGIDSLLRLYPKRRLAVAVFGNVVGYGAEKLLGYAADLAARR